MATLWTSESSVTSRPSAGHNSFATTFCITVHELTGTAGAIVTFDKPCVSTMGHRENIFGVPLVPLPNAPSAGHSLVTILGANFGRLDSSPAARLGASSSSSTLWLLDDRLICRSPPGVGQAFAVVASVSYAVGGTLSASWSYDRPALDEMSQYNIPSPASASSPEKEVIIIGDNFGSCVYSEDSRVGGSASLRTQWISNTIIASKVAQGVGQAMTIVASVAGLQGSSLPVLSFDHVS
ncbi:MAG: IPT/TIG domain-containing protein, partial [Promethearchaeia archaeon]